MVPAELSSRSGHSWHESASRALTIAGLYPGANSFSAGAASRILAGSWMLLRQRNYLLQGRDRLWSAPETHSHARNGQNDWKVRPGPSSRLDATPDVRLLIKRDLHKSTGHIESARVTKRRLLALQRAHDLRLFVGPPCA